MISDIAAGSRTEGNARGALLLRGSRVTRLYSAEKAVRQKSNLLKGFNAIWVVQSLGKKYSAVTVGQISSSTPPVYRDKRGDRDRHDRAVGCDGR
ncbi:hypothetical protein FFI89_021680 [Bradyrhizobium sp. KBS0727]|nr:hypothetical protein FFI71_021685 [Bradyrhizobium sp. KBS0725]QDW46123.1 hypothetical protein FFI89_021680 [Bradyrhizobium sp. KBS0727]